MGKSFRLKVDRSLHGKLCASGGDTVYALRGHDYGCASDDTRGLGVEHVSVTLDPDGGYPFFTVPVHDLEPLP